ncbi:MAG: hypothetical protein GY853_15875 [PVC group bacterium]|nr:hypothetical protein [PVC group bacterium]
MLEISDYTQKEFLNDLLRVKAEDETVRARYDILPHERWWSVIADRSFRDKRDAKEFYQNESYYSFFNSRI